MAEKTKNNTKKYEKALENIKEMNAKHVGNWLDNEGVERYLKRKEDLNITDISYTGKFRELCLEMQKEYGITEIESINIMNGMYIPDYINKYNHIKNMTPFAAENDVIDFLIEIWEKLDAEKPSERGRVRTEFDFDD